jgi:hypothetical protein
MSSRREERACKGAWEVEWKDIHIHIYILILEWVTQ